MTDDRTTERRIESFRQRFGEPHLALACHCAVPLALKPDLAYRIWGTFQHDVEDQPISAPWVAVPDLLLSPLCDEIGEELYGMSAGLRQRLINELVASPRFGSERAEEVARLLSRYVRPALESDDVDSRTYAKAQVWAAEAQVAPARAATDLALAINEAGRADGNEVLRLVSVVDYLSKPFEHQTDLLAYAQAHDAAARGAMQQAQAALTALLDDHGRLTVAGVAVSPPAAVEVSAPPRTDEPLPWRVGHRVAIAVGADGGRGVAAKLLYSERDALSIGEVLAKVGYDVNVLVGDQASRDDVLRAVLSRAADLATDDVVVFFYSGHATRFEDGELYLALNDFEWREDLVALTSIEETLVNSGASRIVFLLDCPGGRQELSSVNAGASAASLRSSASVSLLMPAESYEVSHREHGVFTSHLIQGLDGGADVNADGVITVEELAQYLSEQINAAEVDGPGSGQLLFVSSGEPFALVDRHPRQRRASSLAAETKQVRDAMRGVARGRYSWRPDAPGAMSERTVVSLQNQLAMLARQGARLHDKLTAAGRLTSATGAYRLEKSRPIWIELGPGEPLVPIQAAYLRPIVAGRNRLTLCPPVREYLLDGLPVEKTPCLQGRCPSLDDEAIVCPSGFVGLANAATLSIGPLRPRKMIVRGDPRSLVWVDGDADTLGDREIVIGSITDLVRRIRATSPHVVWLHDVLASPSLRALGERGTTEPPSLLAVDMFARFSGERTPEKLLDEVSELARHGLLYSEVPVGFDLAVDMRRLVLAPYLAGVRADVALRRARLQLLDRGSAAGLAYGLIGAPSLSISPPPP